MSARQKNRPHRQTDRKLLLAYLLIYGIKDSSVVGDVKLKRHLCRESFVIRKLFIIKDVTLNDQVLVLFVAEIMYDVQEVQTFEGIFFNRREIMTIDQQKKGEPSHSLSQKQRICEREHEPYRQIKL